MLRKFLREKFKKIHLQDLNKEKTLFLDQCSDRAFGEEAVINVGIQQAAQFDKKVNNVFTNDYLPFYTRDNDWLTKYLELIIANIRTEYDYEITFSEISNYVEASPYFNRRRNEYERSIVKQYIQGKQDEAFYDTATGFRLRILHEVGQQFDFPMQNIEIAVELNADLWRDKVFEKGLRHYVETVVKKPVKKLTTAEEDYLAKAHYVGLLKLKAIEENLFQEYKKYEEYSYFQDYSHYGCKKNVIWQIGAVTPAMKMSHREFIFLRKHTLSHYAHTYVDALQGCRNLIQKDQQEGLLVK